MSNKLPPFQNTLIEKLRVQQRILDSLKNQLTLPATRISDIVRLTEKQTLMAQYPGIFSALDTMATASVHNATQTLSTLYMSDTLTTLKATLQDSIANSLENILHSYSAIAEAFSSPLMDWLKNYDFSIPLHSILRTLENTAHFSIPAKRFEKICLTALYQARWFPHVVNIADQALIFSICDILDTSRAPSKRCEKRIDAVIYAYFTKSKIKEIKHGWYHSELDGPTKKMLCQTIEAFFRGEYALTISCLSTIWEGLIYIKAHNVTMEERQRQGITKTKEDLSVLTQFNDYEKVYSEFFEKFIVSQCDGVDDIQEGIPNRHGAAHGWYKKYPNKKAALNAILLTDFLLTLTPCVEV